MRADLVKTWQKQALGKRTVVFAVNVQLSKEYAALYNASSGYRAEHIDGKTHKDEREAIFKRFKNGITTILCNCNIVTEGFDLPEMECVQIVRPTQSRSFWLQMVGRSLRISEGKPHAIILDHTDNYKRLGLPDHEYDWSLDSRTRISNFNPYNAEKDSIQDERRPREIEHLEGELVEIYSNSQELENNDMVKIRIDNVEWEIQRSLATILSQKLARLDALEFSITELTEKLKLAEAALEEKEEQLDRAVSRTDGYEEAIEEISQELEELRQDAKRMIMEEEEEEDPEEMDSNQIAEILQRPEVQEFINDFLENEIESRLESFARASELLEAYGISLEDAGITTRMDAVTTMKTAITKLNPKIDISDRSDEYIVGKFETYCEIVAERIEYEKGISK